MRAAAATLVAVLLCAATAAAQALPAGPFLRDEAGRAIFFHGVNAVWKTPPYYPDSVHFNDADAQFLVDNGLTSVRLGVLWVGAEPTRDVFDDDYLGHVEAIIDMLGQHGVSVLLDFHQDMFNEIYQGQGFPPWVTPPAGDPVPNLPYFGFSGGYFLNPGLMHAFDRLWLGEDGLWQEYGDFWTHVAARFATKTNLVGYDLMNEPWPGTQWPTCVSLHGCPVFDVVFLQRFFESAIAAVRSVDKTHRIFWEPQVIADGGAGNDIGLLAKIADSEKKTGLSFHVYCASTLFGSTTPPEVTANDPVCPRNADLAFIQQEIASARNDSTRVLTEFGATDSIPYVSLVAGLADQHMVSWHYWQYAGWSDPTGNPSEEGLFTNDLDRPGSLKQAKADVLIRTYPQAVAGTPTSFSFDPVSKEFTLTYSADPAITAPTEIFVPVARHYDGHYCVVVDGPVTVDSSPDASPLKLAGTGTAGTVHVLVTKRITTCP